MVNSFQFTRSARLNLVFPRRKDLKVFLCVLAALRETVLSYPKATGPSLCERDSRNCSRQRCDFVAAEPSATQ